MTTTPPPTTADARTPANDAEAALVELHKILFPQAHNPCAQEEPWTADTLDELALVVVKTATQLGLVGHTPGWAATRC